jgi:hypothetical protein
MPRIRRALTPRQPEATSTSSSTWSEQNGPPPERANPATVGSIRWGAAGQRNRPLSVPGAARNTGIRDTVAHIRRPERGGAPPVARGGAAPRGPAQRNGGAARGAGARVRPRRIGSPEAAAAHTGGPGAHRPVRGTGRPNGSSRSAAARRSRQRGQAMVSSSTLSSRASTS